MKKRILSFLLAMVMVIGMLPVGAQAEETHSHNNAEFQAWDSTNSLPVEGSYYLTGDVTISQTWNPTGTVNLCLNGHSITQSAAEDIISVNHTLSIYDCSTEDLANQGKITRSVEKSSGIHIYAGGTLNLYGGCITGCSGANKGGAVYNEGTFDMFGGSITGNAAVNGGGVYVYTGSFTMSGGSITKNTASGDGDSDGGGGVYVNSGSFIMSGGSVTNNTSKYGGGVYMNGGSAILSGGSVTKNTNSYHGGGVYMNGGRFTLSGSGSIAENKVSHKGGGVYVNSGSFTLSGGGSITKNTATTDGGGVYVNEQGEFNMTGGSITNNTTSTKGGGVCNYCGTFTMTGGEISSNLSKNDGGGVFNFDSTFTMSGGSKICDNEAQGNGGGVTNSATALFTMNGGSITKNKADGNGGGVYIQSGSTFKMNGGSITENKAAKERCVVVSDTTSSFTVSGGTLDMDPSKYVTEDYNITKNSDGTWTVVPLPSIEHNGVTFQPWPAADSLPKEGSYYLTGDVKINVTWNPTSTVNLCLNGHSITQSTEKDIISVKNTLSIYDCSETQTGKITRSVNASSGIHVNEGATFNLYGGCITGCKGAETGGGVYNDGTFNLYGGSVTGNTASVSGGGVHMTANGSMTVSGNAQITGNTVSDAANNLYLVAGKTITVGALTEGAEIGVTMETSGVFTSNAAQDYANRFTSDNAAYAIHVTEGNTLQVSGHTWTWKNDDNNHWEECACGEKTEPAAHAYVNGTCECDKTEIVGNNYTLYLSGGKVYRGANGPELTDQELTDTGITGELGAENAATYTFTNVNFTTTAPIAVHIADMDATNVTDATIRLVGDNTIQGGAGEAVACGLYVEGARLIIEGDGSLTATAGDCVGEGSIGIYTAYSITQNGGKITGIGGNATYFSGGISCSTFRMCGGEATGIGNTGPNASWGISTDNKSSTVPTLYVSGGVLTGAGNTGGIYAYNNKGGTNAEIAENLTVYGSANKDGSGASVVTDWTGVEDTYKWLQIKEAETPELIDNERTLILEGEIRVKQYVGIDIEGFTPEYICANGGLLIWTSAVEEAEAIFGSEDILKEGLTAHGTYRGVPEYMQESHGIAAKEYADEFYLRAYLKLEDGTYIYSPLKQYSVQMYCENNLKKDTVEQKNKDAYAAMLDYGGKTQIMFNYNTGDLANANLSEYGY